MTESMNASLTQPVTDLIIEDAVFSINPSKSPGGDGFTGKFYHDNWPTIKQDVCNAVKTFFQGDHMLRSINHTLISLIPKSDIVEDMKHLRPISLCTVLYKIISKILSKRLRRIIGNIIDDLQSAFTKDRLISDNILIAHELMHYLKNSNG